MLVLSSSGFTDIAVAMTIPFPQTCWNNCYNRWNSLGSFSIGRWMCLGDKGVTVGHLRVLTEYKAMSSCWRAFYIYSPMLCFKDVLLKFEVTVLVINKVIYFTFLFLKSNMRSVCVILEMIRDLLVWDISMIQDTSIMIHKLAVS